MANRKSVCCRCGRRNRHAGLCKRCVEAVNKFVEQVSQEMPSWKPFIVKRVA